jgi:hypothetical protein
MTTLTRVRTLDATGKVLGTDLVNLDTALYVLNMRHHGSRDYRRICWPNQTYLDVADSLDHLQIMGERRTELDT